MRTSYIQEILETNATHNVNNYNKVVFGILSSIGNNHFGRKIDILLKLDTNNNIELSSTVDYMYLIIDVDGIYYAKIVGNLFLPKSLNELPMLFKTLNLLFCFKNFIENIALKTKLAMCKRNGLNEIYGLVDVDEDDDIPSSSSNMFKIFFTLKANRIRSNSN
ncbi:unnamed protein product [Cunninghamella blakesleeana]